MFLVYVRRKNYSTCKNDTELLKTYWFVEQLPVKGV